MSLISERNTWAGMDAAIRALQAAAGGASYTRVPTFADLSNVTVDQLAQVLQKTEEIQTAPLDPERVPYLAGLNGGADLPALSAPSNIQLPAEFQYIQLSEMPSDPNGVGISSMAVAGWIGGDRTNYFVLSTMALPSGTDYCLVLHRYNGTEGGMIAYFFNPFPEAGISGTGWYNMSNGSPVSPDDPMLTLSNITALGQYEDSPEGFWASLVSSSQTSIHPAGLYANNGTEWVLVGPEAEAIEEKLGEAKLFTEELIAANAEQLYTELNRAITQVGQNENELQRQIDELRALLMLQTLDSSAAIDIKELSEQEGGWTVPDSLGGRIEGIGGSSELLHSGAVWTSYYGDPVFDNRGLPFLLPPMRRNVGQSTVIQSEGMESLTFTPFMSTAQS